YMHDGQHLFDASRNGERVEGNLDETMTALIESGKVEPAIIVGIWNTPKRTAEYMPWAWARQLPDEELDEFRTEYGDPELSDKYLRFIVEELKPFIDRTYRTRTDRESTFVMGISMGGLISLYAATEYQEVFGGAGCVSSHWPIVGAPISYLDERIGGPGSQILYFDYGTESLDAEYEPYQMRVDSLMRAKGYSEDSGWITRKYDGADHSWPAWSKRFHIPLAMFFGRE
ncbi:MAG: alpha/beta hydrolase-fold protein, partial [Rhodothermales bacterium]|nr:alpha/beta hydrolase-fold protein [Rhodothermales bacterium]